MDFAKNLSFNIKLSQALPFDVKLMIMAKYYRNNGMLESAVKTNLTWVFTESFIYPINDNESKDLWFACARYGRTKIMKNLYDNLVTGYEPYLLISIAITYEQKNVIEWVCNNANINTAYFNTDKYILCGTSIDFFEWFINTYIISINDLFMKCIIRANTDLIKFLINKISKSYLQSLTLSELIISALDSGNNFEIIKLLLDFYEDGQQSISPLILQRASYNKDERIYFLLSSHPLVIKNGNSNHFYYEEIAAAGNLKVLIDLCKNPPLQKKKEQIIRGAASCGHLFIIEWLKSITEINSLQCGILPAIIGNSNEFLYEYESQFEIFNNEMLDYAILFSNYAAIVWLLDNNRCAITKRILEDSSRRSDTGILQLLLTYIPKNNLTKILHKNLVKNVANNGDLDLVKYLHSLKNPKWYSLCDYLTIARHGYFELLQYLHSTLSIKFDFEVLDVAIAYNHVEMVKWLLSLGINYSINALQNIINRGNINMFKILQPKHNRISQNMVLGADYDMLKHLLESFAYDYILHIRLFRHSVEQDKLSVLQLFDGRISKIYIDNAIAVSRKQYTIMKLKKLKCSFEPIDTTQLTRWEPQLLWKNMDGCD